jgi:hypothetical protein
MKAILLKAIVPLAAWGFSLLVPAIPFGVWSGLFTAIVSGDLTLDHIRAFLKAHNIRTYSAPSDFPSPPPGENLAPGTTNTNLTVNQP